MPTINLSDALHRLAEEQAMRAGFGSAENYIADLVRQDLERMHPTADALLRQSLDGNGDTNGVTEEALAARKREIEALLVAGLDSGPPVEANAEYWQERQRALQERIATRTEAGGA